MIQHVDYILIGKNLPASYTTADALSAGDVALFDQNRAIIKTAADAVNATSLYVGVAQNKINVTMPMVQLLRKLILNSVMKSRRLLNRVQLLVNMQHLFRTKLLLL